MNLGQFNMRRDRAQQHPPDPSEHKDPQQHPRHPAHDRERASPKNSAHNGCLQLSDSLVEVVPKSYLQNCFVSQSVFAGGGGGGGAVFWRRTLEIG